jgi:hypothetical protein
MLHAKKICLKGLRSEKGSFTLEASVIFPMLLLSTIVLLFLGLIVYQQVFLQQKVQLLSERTAFAWGNSHADPTTGEYNPFVHDGLYWRVKSDRMFSLFRFGPSLPQATVILPFVQQAASVSLIDKKLAAASKLLPDRIAGKMSYNNHIYSRRVEAQLQQPIRVPDRVVSFFHRESLSAAATANVVDPVELIRLTDLVRSYVGLVKQRISAKEAREAFVEPLNTQQSGKSVSILSEREAASYLRALVGGDERELKTHSGSRKIDALDTNGIAHQAIYTFTEGQLRSEQLPKDAELLSMGDEVKGIVWHFFAKATDKATTLSPKFRKELESKGIIVIIHN